jgi:hypothetical protein
MLVYIPLCQIRPISPTSDLIPVDVLCTKPPLPLNMSHPFLSALPPGSVVLSLDRPLSREIRYVHTDARCRLEGANFKQKLVRLNKLGTD